MKIRVYIDKIAALKAGHDKYGHDVIEVQAALLSPEERDELAHHNVKYDSQTLADFDISSPYIMNKGITYEPLAEATTDNVHKLLQFLINKRKEIIAQEEQEQKEEKLKYDRIVTEIHNTPVDNLVELYKDGQWYVKDKVRSNAYNKPELKDKLKHAEELCAQRNYIINNTRNEEKKQIELKKQKEMEEKVALLLKWAKDNGSELLKGRIDGADTDNFEWANLAHREFATDIYNTIANNIGFMENVTIGKDEDEHVSSVDRRTTPTLQEMNILKAIRTLITSLKLPATVILNLVTYKEEDDDDTCKQTECQICVTCPDGYQVTNDFLITPDEKLLSSILAKN